MKKQDQPPSFEELKEYFEKYIKPHAMENITKGLLLPYLSFEELDEIYDKETVNFIKKPEKRRVE